ncbi:hypothetical protein B566_EDAN007691 [Ephemera danica]|nr:hypothetical protein B566_EDAN007691 [Ephemera danica]
MLGPPLHAAPTCSGCCTGLVLVLLLQLLALAASMPTEHAANSLEAADYPDYQAGVRYDEYPLVVPKRTALMLDKMMVALQRALDDDVTTASAIQPEQMDLQRRGQQKGRVYLRCYFNAVTCFKKKK